MPKLIKKVKQAKKSDDKEEENIDDDLIQFDKIDKNEQEETFTFDYIEPTHKYDFIVLNQLRKTFNFVNFDLFDLAQAICE